VWTSPNKIVGTGILIVGTAFEVVSTFWERYKDMSSPRFLGGF